MSIWLLATSPCTWRPLWSKARRKSALAPLQEPEVVFSGSKLRQNLSRTIAETIDYEPGIAQRSMGPAPARPVLRGLGGDRLLVIEDGERTGDLSGTSSDHAVAIEPMTTERIEVVRGPRTLLYGSNALAGVVNVVRGYVPSERPDGFGGSVTYQGESVNRGLSGGLTLEQPLGPLALRFDSSLRNADDIATPHGVLANTDIRTGNASVGLSLVRPWGHVGASGSLYDSDYGIPPDPEGGHPHGVSIDLQRQHLEGRGEILTGPDWLQRLELHHSFSRYQHGEFEASGDLGMEFGVLTHNTGALAHLDRMGPFANGAIGLWYEYRNYAAAGLNFTPPAEEYAGALFTYQEWEHGPWAANAALRVDARRVEPRERALFAPGRPHPDARLCRDVCRFVQSLPRQFDFDVGHDLDAHLSRSRHRRIVFRRAASGRLFVRGGQWGPRQRTRLGTGTVRRLPPRRRPCTLSRLSQCDQWVHFSQE